MSKLNRSLEALLFVSSKPLSVRVLARLTNAKDAEVRAALNEVKESLQAEHHGILLQESGDTVQLVTHPDAAPLLTRYLQEEEFGELSKPALETLTIIAYRGPISKADLDILRGVNCALILRNLLIRGLVTTHGEPKHRDTAYTISHEFLRYLGATSVEELPDYASLAKDPAVEALLHPESVAPESPTTD